MNSRSTKASLGMAAGAGLAILGPAAAIWQYVVELHHIPPRSAPVAEDSEKLFAHTVALLYIGFGGAIALLLGLAIFTVSGIFLIRSGPAARTPEGARLTAAIVTPIAAAFGFIILGVLLLAWMAIAPMNSHALTQTYAPGVPDDPTLPTVTLTLNDDGSVTCDNLPAPRQSLKALLVSKSAQRVIVHATSRVGFDQHLAFLHELERDGIKRAHFE